MGLRRKTKKKSLKLFISANICQQQSILFASIREIEHVNLTL